ncbi:methyltransferase family protein [Erythrobacter crassostreae]|uniref:Protein-S-isoprenylcysteine methyltransferase n=1 Tax=Erythrobacter crassostreae TaxID=2828328 RepID=A0A9X1F3P2_9SPHN|nr:DUF1295 domain-containing protein [Erythrobacter crassostrea]MBV7259574.1 protein-S-isoprenylcysteine methyltransferase [Erythrobacter crassostrea]
MSANSQPSAAALKSEPPKSDVSAGVGLAGLLGLFGWIAFCRAFPLISETFGFTGAFSPDRGVLSGPYAALAALVFIAGPMAVWSILVDRVHLRPSTGIDWKLKRSVADVLPVSTVKIAGIWATYAVLAGLYGLCRWYWDGSYLFAMEVLSMAVIPMVVLAVPYIIWLDRFMIEPKDASWHFGAMLIGQEEWDTDAIKKHWRAWLIKGFFGAFMISILPGGFAFVVEADPSVITSNPIELAVLLITLLFMIDVLVGTVGYLFTLRPLDAHIRSGNPFLSGWLAALICYPPFVWGIIGNNSQLVSYERDTAKWDYWMADNETLLWMWGAWLVALTAAYAWATVAFGIRFSNLTYRGVLTNGPYRYTRHPAYLSKNLYWWCLHLPFLVTSGSLTEAIRNCFFLLVVNAIYYWRARTEEAHMLAEDPKYREYYDWMEHNGSITAPLARLKRRMLGRIDRRGGATNGAAPEPAE